MPAGSDATGYRHGGYAASLEYGDARPLDPCGGWLIGRPIGSTGCVDAVSPYPLFCCRDWARLDEAFETLGGDLVSATIVTDPFGDVTLDRLRRSFPDLMRPFKEHFVVD